MSYPTNMNILPTASKSFKYDCSVEDFVPSGTTPFDASKLISVDKRVVRAINTAEYHRHSDYLRRLRSLGVTQPDCQECLICYRPEHKHLRHGLPFCNECLGTCFQDHHNAFITGQEDKPDLEKLRCWSGRPEPKVKRDYTELKKLKFAYSTCTECQPLCYRPDHRHLRQNEPFCNDCLGPCYRVKHTASATNKDDKPDFRWLVGLELPDDYYDEVYGDYDDGNIGFGFVDAKDTGSDEDDSDKSDDDEELNQTQIAAAMSLLATDAENAKIWKQALKEVLQ